MEGLSNGMPPEDARLYLNPSYWDERFAKEEHYEWFKDYSHFRHLIHSHVEKHSKILEIGCGNSRLSEAMYEDGYTSVTATDLSPVAVKQKLQHCSKMGHEGMKVCVADMLNLPFEDGSFDVVIEKGVMDVLFVDSGSPWDPKPETKLRVAAMLREAHRVLTPAGVMISIAFGQPHFRRPFFEADGLEWCLRYCTFGETFHYFFYTLKKGTLQERESLPRKSDKFLVEDLVHEELDNSDCLLKMLLDDIP